MAEALSFTVTGLNCAGCAGRATRALQSVDGVEEVAVNYANARADVSGGDATALRDALEGAGYPAEVLSQTLELDNMHCASCVARVQTALKSVPGVVDAQVNLATSQAHVQHLGRIELTVLQAATSAVGYEARLRESNGGMRASHRLADEARDQWRLALIAALLTLPVLILEMGSHMIPAFHDWIMNTLGHGTSWTIQAALTTLVLIWPGAVFFRRGVPALLRGAPEMNALVALGTGAAWAYSMVVLLAPTLLPAASRAAYFEAAAVIVSLILVGRALEARAKGQAGAAIEALMDLAPPMALRLDGAGQVHEVVVAELQPGDRLRVLPGARIPLDGHVVFGAAEVDEAMLTGEPLPVAKSQGSDVFAGTVNGTSALEIEVYKRADETVLANIVRQVEAAQAARLPVQDLVDRITAWFVPVVLVLAAATFLVWVALGAGIETAVVTSVSVLIVACPCAMGLAVPTSILAGTGRAAELGVLFRGGAGLQRAADVRVVAFDKTGTLTQGQPSIAQVMVLGEHGEEDVLQALAALEAQSEHPLARAILAAAPPESLVADKVEAIVGRGVVGDVDGHSWALGNAALMAEQGVDIDVVQDHVADQEALGKTVLFASQNQLLIAILSVQDDLKPGATEAVAALQAQGITTALLSGDSEGAVAAAARRLSIPTSRAHLSPSDKQYALKDLADGQASAFVGDGINDAPVLAAADLGIALGSGTDVAIESADVVLMGEDPRLVDTALRLSHAVMANIRQNLFWAFIYNIALIPVAAGAFAWAGLSLQPALAGGAMALSSVFVVTNALRLKRWRS
ncbi:MAG: heavy metal translocating P-type ATPase [Marinovum sp.]|nr:heavy metal translocating P-type ATPase [Marinovum sp.]